jgi:hypothetical protein
MFSHCPKCNSVATVPIAYGKPGWEMEEAAKYGLIHIAGCVIEDPSIDRHCQACGYEWASSSRKALFRDDRETMQRMLKSLEADLQNVHQTLERMSLSLGRSGVEKPMDLLQDIIWCIHDHHAAWDMFNQQLDMNMGTEVILRDSQGNVQSQYTTKTARTYIVKHMGSMYSRLIRLAQSCYALGKAGNKATVDELKRAAAEVQHARQEISQHWQEMRAAALGELE